MDTNKQYQPIMSQNARMTVTSLQLAVISEQILVVKFLLSLVQDSNKDAEIDLQLSMIGGAEAQVDFEDVIEMYGEGDRMLHGCSAFDLAARFHVDSLSLFIDLFKSKESGNNKALQDLLNDKRGEEHPLMFSALHLAACNQSDEGIRHVHRYLDRLYFSLHL